ncbi:hypothetical protein GCM10023219_06500 [Stakelama sediminis]|uniref:Tetratricopeptide (TPR) repeat protein n=1 Tax=Stakelama sediminis TaxID=463200 RepID=A0A840YUZ8_9SPHN|nr:SPOR domain-containing protein [Stakelama sediminis]MBB5717369.1 tetratricopeptide (TPR) repeat protein [Stakelama sediminis]
MLLGVIASPVPAQEVVPPPTPHADKLAADMRVLAKNPDDVDALISAGTVSVRLGDPVVALQFFKRAEDADAKDPRVYGGKAAALVELERPGEALRLFAKADAMGLAPDAFAANRGLAYDLTGHSVLAQQAYRTALAQQPDAQTKRWLALSLGISGKQKEASALLDSQLRKQDKGAWRAQAFILAMNGDVKGAEHIARTILPNVGSELSPYFRRLRSMSAVRRAFAVHFGELSLSPAIRADARLAPPLPGQRIRGGRDDADVAVAARTQPPMTAAGPAGDTAESSLMVENVERARATEKAAATGQPERSDRVVPAKAPPPVSKKPEKSEKRTEVAKAAKKKVEAEPAREWVQVAGGANKATLPRAYDRLVAKAPKLFRGKQAWTTPLRFTNRLLVGPFSSKGAAQAFVNKLAGDGISAFAWTSARGQKIERLKP